MALLLQNKVVAITGASKGIGRGIALGCAKQGALVVIGHIGDKESERDVETLTEEIKALGSKSVAIAGDVAKPESATALVAKAVEAFGKLDVFVSNAGICPFHSFLDMPDELWKKVQDVNLNGAFYGVRAAANQMKEQGTGGSIVAISSISGLVGGEMQSHYTPTKAGLISLMQSCAISLGKFGIRCNAVLPGTIATDINKEDLSDEKKRTYMEGRTCLGRLGKPEDLAGPVIFFASDLSGYVTGSSLLVDGGLFVNLQ
eukprot:TRINITY_DN1289_c0_g1_i1.p1 TRINITY_DN1289_c0_g1~~TRINITY_DN1289_c0_g1_i1.p1  ORF type:complete len:259 (-),score=103.40 TRINITY_DN1289_c0_g1_i1:61-837(-)